MTEVVADDEIISLTCFICGRESEEGDVAFCLFGERSRSGEQLPMISEVLSSLLSFEIAQENAHSKILCNDCNTRVNKYEELEQQMLDIKYKILKDFNMTSRLNDGEIQFEIEETFDDDIDDEPLEEQADDDPDIGRDDHDTIPAATSDETSNTDLLSLLSGHKDVVDSPPDQVVVQKLDAGHIKLEHVEPGANAGQIKLEHVEPEANDVHFLDPSTGNIVEIMTETDEYNPIVVDDHCKAEAQAAKNYDSKELSSTFDSYIFFNGLKYRCLVCTANNSNDEEAYEFDDSESISSHLNAIHDVSIHLCLECDEKFAEKEMLVKHLRDVHGKQDVYYTLSGDEFLCLMCPPESKVASTKFTARTLSTHFKEVHTLRVYICDICGFHFKKRMELTEHVDETHAGTDDGEFRCETCNRVFTNLRQFRIHKRLHYSSTKSYQCNQCNKRYSSKNLLDEHMNMHTGARPYKCHSCTKDFASKYTLTAHMKIHSNRPRPYTCKQCSKSFFSAQNLLQHEKIHSKLKEYVCDVCNKAFGTQHNLEVHKVVHTGYKPFICRTCGKAFARRAEIKDHERTHTGERPFICDICNMSFAQRSNLTTHKRATHLNDKRYKCDKCDRSFKRRRLLDYHTRASHTGERPYHCLLCNATFVYPEHFKKHLRIHSGVKPYSCEVCGKSFNSRDNRNTHRFIHSDKKPYECLVCGQGFMRKPLLYTHMQQSGHVNDTIIINQPRILAEDDEKLGSDENVLIEMVQDDELVEEQLIDGPSQYATSADEEMDDVLDHPDDNSMSNDILDSDLTEVITDQFVVRYDGDGDAEPMQLVQIRTKDESGKDAFTWVNLVSEKTS